MRWACGWRRVGDGLVCCKCAVGVKLVKGIFYKVLQGLCEVGLWMVWGWDAVRVELV